MLVCNRVQTQWNNGWCLHDSMFQGAYVRQGKHLILRSMLASPKAVLKRVSTARSRPDGRVTAANAAARQRVAAARTRRPSRLSKSSKSAQTHCLVFCRHALSICLPSGLLSALACHNTAFCNKCKMSEICGPIVSLVACDSHL